MKWQIIISCLLLAQCNSSSFTGSSQKKEKKISPDIKDVILDTESQEIQKDPPLEVDKPITECFEEPLPLPETVTEPAEMYTWKPTGDYASYANCTAPIVGTIIGDTPSILAVSIGPEPAQDTYIFAIDGKTGATQWQSDLLTIWQSPAIGDIDNDHKNEVVAIGVDGYIYALFGADGSKKWKSDTSINMTFSPTLTSDYKRVEANVSLADLDGDGTVEIVAGNKVFDGKTGLEKFSLPDNGSGENAVGNINKEKGIEIITPTGIYSGMDGHKICEFGQVIYHMGFAKMRAEDKQYTVIGMVGDFYMANPSWLTAYSSDDCSEVFQTKFPDAGGGPVNIADFDGDNELEIGIAGYSNYFTFETDGTEKWRVPNHDFSSHTTGSTTFDFNGDGANEVIYADETSLRIFEGKTGKELYKIAHVSGTMVEYPVIADVDNDGHANLVIVDNGGANIGVRVFRAPGNDWIGTRSIWNQYSYNIVNVADNGALVSFDLEAIWKKYNYIKSEHLLGFRNNLPIRPMKKCDD